MHEGTAIRFKFEKSLPDAFQGAVLVIFQTASNDFLAHGP